MSESLSYPDETEIQEDGFGFDAKEAAPSESPGSAGCDGLGHDGLLLVAGRSECAYTTPARARMRLIVGAVS
jgi:hypothetical protein